MGGPSLSKAARSALARVPRLYAALAGVTRYRLMHALHVVHEPEFRLLPDLLQREDPLVLDVGGNVGQSVLSILTVLPHARVITFEPNPANHPALESLTARYANVELRPFGLGEVAGDSDFFIPVYNGRPISGLASFEESAARSGLTYGSIYGFDEKLRQIEQTTASIRRLDELGLSPDVIKIDVQGLEDAVIAGGLETIRRSRPIIIAEAVREDSRAVRLLSPLGYRRWELQKGRLVEAGDRCVNQVLLPEPDSPT
jgi:FkbM family methyltransferase